MTAKTGLAKLREPFAPNQIGKRPQPYKKDSPKGQCKECGGYHGLPAMHLDYVGHAALTDRLLDADPEWTWEPFAVDEHGLPMVDRNGGLWIKLTVCGVTKPGYGDAEGKTGTNAVKEAIGDALRNAGMRFGIALDLWHKGDLHEAASAEPEPVAAPLTPAPQKVVKAELPPVNWDALLDMATTKEQLEKVGADLAASGVTGDDRDRLRALYTKRLETL
jgi:hypothetical protein